MGIPHLTYISVVADSVLKEVACENCKTAFVYDVKRAKHGTGKSLLFLDNEGAEYRARIAAEAALQESLEKAIDPVPCPSCGWFQANMCKLLKRRRLYLGLGISLPIALIFLIWALAIGGHPGNNATTLKTVAACVAAGGIVVAGAWSTLHNPNRAHPGPLGKDATLAATSKGMSKADFEAGRAKSKEEAEAKFQSYLLESMIHMAAADGSLADAELECVSNFYLRISGKKLSIETLRQKDREIAANKAGLLQNLCSFSINLPESVKELFIQAGVVVATNDGDFNTQEWDFLVEVGRTLNLTEQHVDFLKAKFRCVTSNKSPRPASAIPRVARESSPPLMIDCPHCRRYVLPANSICPSCRKLL